MQLSEAASIFPYVVARPDQAMTPADLTPEEIRELWRGGPGRFLERLNGTRGPYFVSSYFLFVGVARGMVTRLLRAPENTPENRVLLNAMRAVGEFLDAVHQEGGDTRLLAIGLHEIYLAGLLGAWREAGFVPPPGNDAGLYGALRRMRFARRQLPPICADALMPFALRAVEEARLDIGETIIGPWWPREVRSTLGDLLASFRDDPGYDPAMETDALLALEPMERIRRIYAHPDRPLGHYPESVYRLAADSIGKLPGDVIRNLFEERAWERMFRPGHDRTMAELWESTLRAQYTGPISAQNLNDYAEHFFGYGPDANMHFVGLEEGGGASAAELFDRIHAWHQGDRRRLVDLDRHHSLARMARHGNDWFGDRPPLQRTWAMLIRLAAAFLGHRSLSAEDIRREQRDCIARRCQLGASLCGRISLLELLPLPARGLGTWPYAEWTSAPWARTRRTYEARWLDERYAGLLEILKTHSCRAVVCYGLARLPTWLRLAEDLGVRTEVIRIGKRTCWIGRTTGICFAIAEHPAAHGVTARYFERVGELLSGS